MAHYGRLRPPMFAYPYGPYAYVPMFAYPYGPYAYVPVDDYPHCPSHTQPPSRFGGRFRPNQAE